jgi:DNA-binding NarL/FixJ family response regulator/predicted negative regulator of RcsB-dependent stress response
MPSSDKITVILADEDALRRDGLAAVLLGTAQFEILAKCPDGTAALEAIREHRPDVAVVDLNLPGLHGIELVRRVRSEALGSKVVILAGTTDDEIIREVVRAGADGYLLKNGPARHLIDAISYVRDGGQYFSPQLRRDGRDRHLLEETPRPLSEAPPAKRQPDREREQDQDSRDHDNADQDDREIERSPRSARISGSRPQPSRHSARASSRRPVREQLREESKGNLKDRDYEILDMMAEGIRPILDRLEDIEGRIVEMETGDEPVPSDVRGWLNSQIADTMGHPRSAAGHAAASHTVNDLESRLPQMIEQAVTSRFQQMAGKLQKEIEDTHVRTLETFVKNIQVKLVQRVAALETDMTKQADAMKQLREYSQRTEDNLSRLITGVDKLAQDLPRRLQAPQTDRELGSESESFTAPPAAPRAMKRKSSSRNFPLKMIWLALGVLIVLGIVVVDLRRSSSSKHSTETAPSSASSPATGAAAPASSAPTPPSANSDVKTKMDAAQQYSDRKEYSAAEDIYRQVIKADPNNVDALKALASVLYREDKIEESAAILDKLPKN